LLTWRIKTLGGIKGVNEASTGKFLDEEILVFVEVSILFAASLGVEGLFDDDDDDEDDDGAKELSNVDEEVVLDDEEVEGGWGGGGGGGGRWFKFAPGGGEDLQLAD
jgi:hypothetical protein